MPFRPTEDMPKHQEAMRWMNEALIYFKLQLQGVEPPRPLTLEFIQEGERLHSELERCRERTIFY